MAENKGKVEHTLDLVNTWINNIDSKASYALSLAGILIGFTLIQGVPQAFSEWENAAKMTAPIFIKVVLVILLYIFSLASICSFVLALIARITPLKDSKSHLFFGNVSTLNLEQFTKEFTELSDDDYVKELLEQVHTNSCICSKKAKWYNRGIKYVLITIVLCFICIIFQLI